ncbi:MAG: ABC transporter permease [Deltaproteobacteria bacterium]|jgi:putative ABC transport system permease protein|nr:ABC transporter permease [Deltaproteobacteria bacterium]
MLDSFYIAWKYVSYNKIKTATLVACITLITFLPFSLELLLNESERQLMSRAVHTPLIVGAKGSSLDLVMNTLYFGEDLPELITMAASDRIADTDLALPIPMYVRFKARGNPIVGITLDYFDFRGLKIAQGRQLAVLGECVVGEKVAESLALKPGDSLVSSPESLFDLAGIYPLKMKVVGVLEKSHTSDDLAVFVDLKTAWVIQGLGHGHQDVTKIEDTTLILKRTESNVSATAKLFHYTEITEKNMASFHFHGNLSAYPISALIALPYDTKSGTILRGRYLSKEETQQIVKPEEVIAGLLQNIFRIKNVLDAVIAVVALATVLAVILVFALSLRLRQREIQTIFKIGCSRMTIVKLMAAEIMIIVLASAVLCSVMIFAVQNISHELVRMLFIR